MVFQKMKKKRLLIYLVVMVHSIIAFGQGMDKNAGLSNDISCPDDHHPHQIDLGIGKMWACCNVGATSPEQPGGYYAWGETCEKDNYTWENYQSAYQDEDGIWHGPDFGDISCTSHDVAHVVWGSNWQMPSIKDMEDLLEHCTFAPATLNGVAGIKITGPNNQCIFLPYAGYRHGKDLFSLNNMGYYSSCMPIDDEYNQYSYGLFIQDGSPFIWYWNNGRIIGHSVRAVVK